MAVSFECINWRDAASSLCVRKFLKNGKLFRGGSIAYCSWESVGCPMTVINFRPETDDPRWQEPHGVQYIHIPADSAAENYESSNPVVKKWVYNVLSVLADEKQSPSPILMHCRSGRDRTGVIVAALLTTLGATREIIEPDWLSVPGTKPELTKQCLDGFVHKKSKQMDMKQYLRDSALISKLICRFRS